MFLQVNLFSCLLIGFVFLALQLGPSLEQALPSQADLVNRRSEEENLPLDSPLVLSYGRNRGGKRLGYQGLYYTVKSLGKIAATQVFSLITPTYFGSVAR